MTESINRRVDGLNVVIDAHSVGLRTAGNEQYFTNLIAGLAGLTGDQPDYFILNHRSIGASELTHPGMEIVPLRSGSVAIQRAWEIPAICKKIPADVLHVPFNFLPVGRCKKVVTIHDLAFLHVKESFTWADRTRMRWLTGLAAKKADHILTVSEYSKRDIVETYGVPEEKVSVTYNGVDRQRFCRWSSERRQSFREEKAVRKPFFLFVGTLQPRKNILFMLEAFKMYLARTGADMNLLLIGRKGWKYRQIFSYVQENGLTGRVRFLDDVGNDELPGYYNTSEALVMPSIFEGFGMPLVEAMSCGCPVLSSNRSCLPEIYGSAAIPFDPEVAGELVEAMMEIAGNHELKAELVGKGYENARRFSWTEAASITRKVYFSL